MRTFISIELDNESVISRLDQIRTELGAPARTNPVHLTLAFLGDVDESVAERISSSLDSVEFKSFEIQVATLGAFGSKTNPRIVWAGIQNGLDCLLALADSVSKMMRPFGFLQDGSFVPHITLFRVKGKNENVIDVLGKYQNAVFGIQSVTQISLMRSVLSDNRYVHRVLRTVGALA